MTVKVALALVVGCLAAPAIPQEAPVYADIPQVVQVMCATTRGTAFRTGVGALVTARHVITGEDCRINGEPVNITWQSEELDMAVLRTKEYGKPLPIDCSGFHDGEDLAGVGYARGRPVQQVIFVQFNADIDARADRWGKFSTLFGNRFIPGQSGGAVFGRDGRVVGIVNGYNTDAPLSYSQALKDTPLCK